MKSLFLTIMTILIFTGMAFGGPFLVCDDPISADEVTEYILKFNIKMNIKIQV